MLLESLCSVIKLIVCQSLIEIGGRQYQDDEEVNAAAVKLGALFV
jgi:hypothetical protein